MSIQLVRNRWLMQIRVDLTVNQQVQEIALIRQGLYELEAQHAKIQGE